MFMSRVVCPNCGQPEDIKDGVCAHCGHEYQYDDSVSLTFCNFLVAVGVIVVIMWAFVTVFWWMLCQVGDDPTLCDVIKRQWEFIKNLKLW